MAFDYDMPNSDFVELDISKKLQKTNFIFVFQVGGYDAIVNHLVLTIRAESVHFFGLDC